MVRNFFSCICVFLFTGLIANAQLSENFNDGDFSKNPVWSGSTSDFTVNPYFQLQSYNNVANSNYFLSTPNSLATTAQWEFYIQILFNPSSANYIDVYLTSASSDFTSTGNTGYFVRMGNTDDEISLYRRDANGSIIKIIDGTNGVLNSSSNKMKIKIVRDAANQWTLSRDMSGIGNAFTKEGSAIDATYTSSSYFGFYIKQSTASFFQKHFFDNIEIKNYEPDITPPSISSVQVITSNKVDILFNEPLEIISSELVSNYYVANIGSPMSAINDVNNPALVHLTFAVNFTNAVAYTLTVNGVKDVEGNSISNGVAGFSFYTPQQYDVVIDEIMADPTPQVGLPNSEWIELKNTSSLPINLLGWKLADATGKSGAMPNFMLQPDSVVIVCAASALPALSNFGKAISVTGFPSLDNDQDLIALYSSTGKTIHAVQYSSAWHKNDLKKDGGWSLEMIDTKSPCVGFNNWTSSVDQNGGSPGKKNSVNGVVKDDISPKLLRAFAKNDSTITLVFNEPLDSLEAAKIDHYKISNGVVALKVNTLAPVFDRVDIVLSNPITTGIIYTIVSSGVTDCIGNPIAVNNVARFGLTSEANNLDVVINEILFNPKPQGVDYVELYNRSKKIIDLNEIYIANRNASNVISSIQKLAGNHLLLFPGDFILISADPAAVKNQYITLNPEAFITTRPMPSLPDNEGDVVILNNQGNIVDEVKYSDKWHFPLVRNKEGVSLERIDYEGLSVQSNFHSAATSAGFGTPGYKNSQYRLNEEVQGTISVSPEIFSPDNDGVDDFATINYSFPAPGYVSNITIFDASGRVVRYLQRNALNGIKGYYRWDGLDDKSKQLPQGIYIIYTEIFNTEGKRNQFKNTIVLARRY
ncbi:MAG: lamin tail domain-containing protein [Bacteroidota bacterium]|nr:lamin tail domain-containing protein [Bacteroidota bacterium]